MIIVHIPRYMYMYVHVHVPITAAKFCTEQVNLYEAGKCKALSGGIRRRLSVAKFLPSSLLSWPNFL